MADTPVLPNSPDPPNTNTPDSVSPRKAGVSLSGSSSIERTNPRWVPLIGSPPTQEFVPETPSELGSLIPSPIDYTVHEIDGSYYPFPFNANELQPIGSRIPSPPFPVDDKRSVSFAEQPFVIPSPSTPISNQISYPVYHTVSILDDYFFNLAAPKFLPMRFVSDRLEYVQVEDLRKPATDPPIYRLQIICNLIPQWPIVFQPNADRLPQDHKLSPITVGDILVKLYHCMHLPIQKSEWDVVPEEYQSFITEAYARRCRLSGKAEAEERRKGVKRIDFCRTWVWLNELISVPTSGIPVMLLKLSEGSS
ncbi:hypothetical protein NP233_g9798 [Leucocoprinus birnbaumii]|uniref:DUF6699 domain-containing protein n=1 Tax=Leucocoprinus birnbaumii TaxID=56174 RepID=A0AAD5VLH3_9AGAR|nr:hypothetical protein NP233_g9798 [Leucocoprinus birnbaumii]